MSDETIGYADAMRELEEILVELEGDELDVDVLAERVRRASELIKLCRARITRAQDDVAKIVADLEDFADDNGAGEAAAVDDEELEDELEELEADYGVD